MSSSPVGASSREATPVRDASSLQRLTRGPARLLGPGAARFEIAGATAEENAGWERRLRRHRGACGCLAGAAALAVTLAALAAGRLVLGASVGLVAAVIVAFGAALLGKIGGLAYARVALRRLEREVTGRMEAGP